MEYEREGAVVTSTLLGNGSMENTAINQDRNTGGKSRHGGEDKEI